jgi:hypothetical protein
MALGIGIALFLCLGDLWRVEDRRRLRMAVTATDVRIFYLDLIFSADGVDFDTPNEPQPAPDDTRLQHHVRAGVGAQDRGHRAAGA